MGFSKMCEVCASRDSDSQKLPSVRTWLSWFTHGGCWDGNMYEQIKHVKVWTQYSCGLTFVRNMKKPIEQIYIDLKFNILLYANSVVCKTVIYIIF